jgi:hypothetical protein
MDNRFQVEVSAGTMMSASSTVACFPHRWTPGGVTVEADFTGGHLLHLAAAGCVLNDAYREAAALGNRIERGPGNRGGWVRHRNVAVYGYRLFGRGQLRCLRRSAWSPARGGESGSRDSPCHPSRSHRPTGYLSQVPAALGPRRTIPDRAPAAAEADIYPKCDDA